LWVCMAMGVCLGAWHGLEVGLPGPQRPELFTWL